MRTMLRRVAVTFVVVGVVVASGGAGELECSRMTWLMVGADGTVVTRCRPDLPINPASVVKVATSLWALEELGPGHRWVTELAVTGEWDRTSGTVGGDLVVVGGADPDFHDENAWLVAAALNRAGVRQVAGDLMVVGRFWIGWEHGSEGRIRSPLQRTREMGRRLRRAFDPGRWDGSNRGAWQGLQRRRPGLLPRPPTVVVAGDVVVASSVPDGAVPVVRHRSNPALRTLKRFNAWSNNDIERIAEGLGGVAGLERFVTQRLEVEPAAVQLETASGLGRNRMTARTVVSLLGALEASCDRLGIDVDEVLVVPGCDPGPMRRIVPRLAAAPRRGTVTCKSGTLKSTDGGVTSLAGFVETADGRVRFCAAVPHAGSDLIGWRQVVEGWLLQRIDELAGVQRRPCAVETGYSDSWAEVVTIEGGEDA